MGRGHAKRRGTGDQESRPRPDLGRLRKELLEAAALEEPTERLLEAAAIISEAFTDLSIRPVVVGGLALAYWSDSEFQTGDIDVLMPRTPELNKRLEALGLEKMGRDWILPGGDIAFEAPGRRLSQEMRQRPSSFRAAGGFSSSRSRTCCSGGFVSGFTGISPAASSRLHICSLPNRS